MIVHHRTWLTPEARHRLTTELAGLLSRRMLDGQDQVVDAWLTRKERIREIYELLDDAGGGGDPPDDGVAEPGMVLTVRYEDTGSTETFLLGVPGAEDGAIEVCSTRSPLGSALSGARPEEKRSFAVPSGARRTVTLLSAVPYGEFARQAAGSHPPPQR